MVSITALTFVISLVDGHRLQPSSLTLRNFHSPDPSSGPLSPEESPITVESEESFYYPSILDEPSIQAAGDTPPASIDARIEQAESQVLARASSLLEEHAKTYKPDLQWIRSQWVKLPKLPIEHQNVLGYLAMFALLAFISCICPSCGQRLHHYYPMRKTRFQYTHNGRPVYEWDQTLEDATIYIRPPEGLTKRDLEIKIAARHLRVGRKGKPAFLLEETYDIVNKDRSTWSLRNGELQIHLKKARKVEWPAVLLHKQKSTSSNQSLHALTMNSKYKIQLSSTQQTSEKPSQTCLA